MNRAILKARLCVLSIAVCSFFYSPQSKAQSVFSQNGNLEAGIGLGPMFFLGDLGGSAGTGRGFIKDIDLPLTKLATSAYLSYHPNEWLNFRLALNHGVVEGNDAQAPNKGGDEIYRINRNLHFKSHIWEAYVAAEVYPTVFLERYDGLKGKLRPYGVIGIGGFRFNPKAKDNNGNWVALQPLRTEGQGMAEYPDRKPYSLFQLEIPMGLGIKYYVTDKMYVGLELLHRQLFTDYIDDVSKNYIDPIHFDTYLSPDQAALAKQMHYRQLNNTPGSNPGNSEGVQRGDPKDNDSFFSTLLKVGIRFNEGDTPNKRARKQLRCPVFY
ncbi:hypothetical protein ACFS6H_14675 [Terrimonas rubra]|uniref:Outer membrane protein beta-barrel domain-containing protein n=1 Tax=Terrimonas rubra TaxID=1035890 RepID=A0ABW6A7S3_9BACT